MSSTVIHREVTADGVLVDVTSMKLLDGAGTYGVKRLDTGAVVVAAGTDLARLSTGVYEYTFTDPAPGLTYQYAITLVYLGETITFERQISGGADASIASYCTLEEADAIAAALPGLAKYKAADAASRTAALLAATLDVDAAGPWQGRKFDLTTPQVLEFPRVPYSSSFSATQVFPVAMPGIADVVWDWDPATKAAVVPARVKRATLYQADAILAGKLYKALDDYAIGVASKGVGSLNVSYRDPATLLSSMAGALDGLCRLAANQMKDYRLKQGRML